MSWEGADESPGLGSTTTFTGTVGTTVANVPSVEGSIIFEALIRCPSQTPTSNILFACFDGSGTNFHELKPGESISCSLRGGLKQVKIKGNVAAVKYEVTLNRIG
jgi:hypothetical protein